MMLTNRLRHRIHFQELVEEQNSETGESIFSWQTAMIDSETLLDSVPDEVLTGPGREFSESGTTQSEITARINLRWFPGLSTEWRILWDGKIFNIVSKETDATARREYRLRCKDVVSDGR